MLTYFYDWIWTLTCFFVLVTAILQMLPRSGYRGYVRFFAGLVLVCLLMEPLCGLFGKNGLIFDGFDREAYGKELEKLEEMADAIGGANEGYDGETQTDQGTLPAVEEIRIGR